MFSHVALLKLYYLYGLLIKKSSGQIRSNGENFGYTPPPRDTNGTKIR